MEYSAEGPLTGGRVGWAGVGGLVAASRLVTQFCSRPILVWPLCAYKDRLSRPIDAVGCGGGTVAQRRHPRPTEVANRPMSGLYRYDRLGWEIYIHYGDFVCIGKVRCADGCALQPVVADAALFLLTETGRRLARRACLVPMNHQSY